ncbi:MAG TPA: hypothetical protein VD930_09110 [Gemmatimonadales bacterium]|nr:hypothetical protein [Gemmatimonadales bacterium]
MNCVLRILLLTALLQSPSLAHAQTVNYDAATGDSVALYGLWPIPLENGDTALMFVLRSFTAVGDTVRARKEALGWWPWLSAQVKVRGYSWAGINVIWPKDQGDSLFNQGIADKYSVLFGRDYNGCWHLLGDTVQVSTCSPLSR